MLNRHELFRLRHLPKAAMALAACGATGAMAQVGNSANGASLYVQKVTLGGAQLACQDCHGFAATFRVAKFAGANEASIKSQIDGAIGGNSGGMNVFSFMTSQQRSDIAAYILVAAAPPPPPPFAPLPTPTASPGTVLFNSTAVGAVSSTTSILLTNSAGVPITLANPFMVPATGQVADFRSAAVPTGQTPCINSGTLDPGMSCSIAAQFAPTASGLRSATWNINFSTANTPSREITLQGTATGGSSAPVVGTTPAPSAANSPLNAGAGALGWLNLLGLLTMLGVSRTRRR
ncbi:MAG: hypothetical protein ABJA83_02660 [Burkholderiaceae bacterium]